MATTTDQQQQEHKQQTASEKRKADAKAKSPYTKQEQLRALDSLIEGSDNPDWDARHIFGYNKPDHEPSMLQIITATRVLDSIREEKEQQQQQQLSQKEDEVDTGRLTITGLEQKALEFRKRHGPVLNLQFVIQQQASNGTMALAAEFKRASPSKGIMATDANLTAAQQTSIYAEAGANIISILTEPRWFLGGLDDLTQARLATAAIAEQMNHNTTTTTTGSISSSSLVSRPAILCKEFIVNEYMIAQAAAAGADSCLLIVAVLPQHLLKRLISYARSLQMEPLVEVHATEELDVALEAGAKVIGVNNRNLHTFQMDLSNSERIAQMMTERGLPFQQATDEYTLCALSGMSNAVDVNRYRLAGLQMCLIGESLMRSSNPAQAIAGLCLNKQDYDYQQTQDHQSRHGISTSGAYTAGCQLIKVCGITHPDDALAACEAGANLIGVIFAERSKRKVTPHQAKAVVSVVRDFGERLERHSILLSENTSSPPSPPLRHLVECSRALAEAATPRRPLVVGVFQNQDPIYVAQMVHECGLDLVQLHGHEGFSAANRQKCGGVPAIRVVDITVDPETGHAADDSVQQILENLTNDPIAILLDTAIKTKDANTAGGGGTGIAFNWNIAQAVQNAGLPVLIAGGLKSSNIADCVMNIRPFGVDVSSGVEESPGRKNHKEVRSFVQTARRAAVDASQGF